MKIPRDITGMELAKALRPWGYEIVRQTGSHLRLTRQSSSEQHLTIPRHKPLKTGLLSGILGEAAEQIGISKAELIDQLYG